MTARKKKRARPLRAASKPRRAAAPADIGQKDPPERETSVPFPVVGIGASAGGLEPLSEMMRALPPDTGMAFVLVQHLDPTHVSMLRDILSKATAMPVLEVHDNMPVEPNHVYVIPRNTNMELRHGVLQLWPRTEARGMFRPIDVFLRSLATEQGHKAIGVILSGGATDGTLGLEEIKAEGGVTFAQDATAQQESMPRSAIASGVVDFVLPPNEIAEEITRISRHPHIALTHPPETSRAEPAFARVLEIVRQGTGVDFDKYKRNTLFRRITRRMLLHRMDGLADYAHLLDQSSEEVEALFQDILISVTSFFRNPEGFEVLKSKAFPALTKNRSRHDPVRVWVLGCSTGEEAYSVAIAFAEYCESIGRVYPLQIFATDLNGAGVERARAGVYGKSIAHDVSPDRLRRYFTEIDGNYRVAKPIRDSVVFARHNVLTDPPFSHMDLVTCRNLLIYLEPVLQQRIIPILHYALNPQGLVWLGNSETIGSFRDLFEVVDTKNKLYTRKAAKGQLPHAHFAPVIRGQEPSRKYAAGPFREQATAEMQKEADRILLSRYAPAGVLVNAEYEIVQFRGNTGSYLAPAPGKASLNLLKMVREGLLVGVRGALHKAKREGSLVREEGLRCKTNGGYREVNLEVVPIKSGNELSFLVLFEEPRGAEPGKKPRRLATAAEKREGAAQVKQLTQELEATREYLQAVIEQQEATNEELQSANEEVQSANEELQSINEELETSKEEIQSSNEELATVNDELHNRNVELTQSNNDLQNLFASVPIAIVMLGADLRIRRFTPMAEKMLNLIAADVGRPIGDMKLNIEIDNLEQQVLDVIETMAPQEREVRDRNGRWYALRIRPYRTEENKIEGAVVVLVDIDKLKRNEETLQHQANLLHQALEPICVWEFGSGQLTYWNRAASETYGFTRDEALGKSIHELLHTAPAPALFRKTLQEEGTWAGELTHTTSDGTHIIVDSRMVLVAEGENAASVIETMRPITERKRLEQELHARADALVEADRRKNEFLAILAHELRNPLAPLSNAVHLVREPTASEDVRGESIEMIERQMRRLTQLVDDLLDVSRIEHGKIILRMEPVELRAFLRAVADDARSLIDTRGQELELSLPNEETFVRADPARLSQVFGNLLSNASKYSDTGARIRLTAKRIPARDGKPARIALSVADEGIGIDPENLVRVFDLFAQEDRSVARASGGLGIGLTLARTLVRLHGGEIEARSKGHGHGSEFIVTLDVLQDVPPLPQPRSAKPMTTTVPRRVLIVDDNDDAADSLAEVLRLTGHQVEVAYNGVQASQKVQEFNPEVVVLDLGLPTMDGFEIARRVREHSGSHDVTLIALTGYGQDEDRRNTREAGFDYHITKPADISLLRSLIAGDGEPVPGVTR